jgi:hypothetical protein
MTRDEATARAAERNAAASKDEHWLVKETGPGDWTAVRISGPGVGAMRASGSLTESRPRPETPADPRPGIMQNIPPFGPG